MGSIWVSDLPFSDADRQAEDLMTSCWANFAATRDPNGKGQPVWPAFDPANKLTMQVGDATSVIPVSTSAQFQFFKLHFDAQPAD